MKQTLISLFLLLSPLCFAENYKQEAVMALQKKNAPLALQLLQKAEELDPTDLGTVLQVAGIYFVTHNYTAAADYYERALALNPQHITTRYNCATAYNRSGNFSRSLELYESLYDSFHDDSIKAILFKLYVRSQQWQKAAALQTPELWWYNENIGGKTIVLDIDKPGNGLGDAIQFIRYAQILKQAGAHIAVKAPKPLLPLLQRCSFIDHLVVEGQLTPPHDHTYTICIASLLLRTKDQSAMHSLQRPYLTADPDLITFWKNRIDKQNSEQHAASTSCKVGICWDSNFVHDRFTGTVMPSPRSISLQELAPLADTAINFYSLQKVKEPIASPFPLVQYTDDFDESHGRFMDTAALIMNMDLIITVDTSIAHLAGALGKPVWLLLSCESDYRWFIDDEYSPLYPHMKLFRQKTYRAWEPVIETMKQKLLRYITTLRKNR